MPDQCACVWSLKGHVQQLSQINNQIPLIDIISCENKQRWKNTLKMWYYVKYAPNVQNSNSSLQMQIGLQTTAVLS